MPRINTSGMKGPLPFDLFMGFELTPKKVVRRRTIFFDINALADFEQETGMGFGQLMSQKAIFATARALTWAGLKHEDRALTINQVGTLIGRWMQENPRENTIDKILTVCFEAAKEQGAFGTMGDDEEGDGGSDSGNESDQPTPRASRGTRSSGARGSSSSSPSPSESSDSATEPSDG